MELLVVLLCLAGLVIFVRWLMPRNSPPVEVPPGVLEAAPQRMMTVAEAAARFFPDQIAESMAPAAFPVEPRRRAVRAALKNMWKMTITYVDEHGAQTERTVYPLFMKTPMLVRARCELRQDERTFRLDRIRTVEVHAARQDARDRYRVA